MEAVVLDTILRRDCQDERHVFFPLPTDSANSVITDPCTSMGPLSPNVEPGFIYINDRRMEVGDLEEPRCLLLTLLLDIRTIPVDWGSFKLL